MTKEAARRTRHPALIRDDHHLLADGPSRPLNARCLPSALLRVVTLQEGRLRAAQAAADHPALFAGGVADDPWADPFLQATDGFIAAREAFEAAWAHLKEATGRLLVGA